jgi:hypothetical protein
VRNRALATAFFSALALSALGGCSGDDAADPATDGGDTDAGADGGDADSDVDTDPSTDPDDDNDGDGLTNGQEEEYGTDPNLIDTDSDGYSDFMEWVAGTDPLDKYSNPMAEGDFVFVAPYSWLPSPALSVLVLTTGDTAMDLSASLRDDETDDEDAAPLMERVSPNTEGGIADPTNNDVICVGGLATADDDGDSIPDRFVDVPPGTTVCFDVVPAKNEWILPSSKPTIYQAYIDVVGDDVTTLDTRTVYFYIPT